MILVITDTHDQATTEVMEWLHWLGGDFKVMSGNSIFYKAPFSYSVSNTGNNIRFENDPVDLNPKVVFYRRWRVKILKKLDGSVPKPSPLNYISDLKLREEIITHINAEHLYSDLGCLSLFNTAYWLSSFGTRKSEQKLETLICAQQEGLLIPPTLVTTKKTELKKFYVDHGTLITKSIHNASMLVYEDSTYMMFTQQVRATDIEQLPEQFFVSLFQKQIEKELELRIFFLETEFYAMAIFSQSNDQTQTDFRDYSTNRPNRNVPFTLPPEQEDKLSLLMKKLDLRTGSIDMILTPEGEYYFLEVNPVGMFGMTSHPCNYQLEKKVAEHLIEKDK
jgi:ATP-GRASP peptide maturase of grasp-with-spasm system